MKNPNPMGTSQPSPFENKGSLSYNESKKVKKGKPEMLAGKALIKSPKAAMTTKNMVI